MYKMHKTKEISKVFVKEIHFLESLFLFFFLNSNLIQYDNIPIKAARPMHEDLLSPREFP